jgi:hypothetical protein
VYVASTGEYNYKIIILALGLNSEIFCQHTWTLNLLRTRVLCLNEKAWQYLCVLSTLRSVINEFHEIHIMCIDIIFKKLSMETGVQVHVRELSDFCFIMKVSKTDLFEKLIHVHFIPTTDLQSKTSL